MDFADVTVQLRFPDGSAQSSTGFLVLSEDMKSFSLLSDDIWTFDIVDFYDRPRAGIGCFTLTPTFNGPRSNLSEVVVSSSTSEFTTLLEIFLDLVYAKDELPSERPGQQAAQNSPEDDFQPLTVEQVAEQTRSAANGRRISPKFSFPTVPVTKNNRCRKKLRNEVNPTAMTDNALQSSSTTQNTALRYHSETVFDALFGAPVQKQASTQTDPIECTKCHNQIV